MGKWRVSIDFWEEEYEAEDGRDALAQANNDFSIWIDARTEEIEPDGECDD